MRSGNNVTQLSAETRGMLWGLLGVVAFSLTLPATRVAVPEMGAIAVGLGRALVAAVLAGALLLARREPLPARRHLPGLALVALGVVIGFPLCTAIALRDAPASHAIVVIGLSPIATALVAVWRAGERPPRAFWPAAVAGAASVVAFAMLRGAHGIGHADAWLALAVALVAVGYAEGGRLAREMGGWRVISWALVLSVPVAALAMMLADPAPLWTASPAAWVALAYVGVVSMFLGFLAWYRGLALGGIARVSQVQLLQPLFSVAWAATLLDEPVGADVLLPAALVVACAAWSRRAAGAVTTPATAPMSAPITAGAR
jgi:drug/metabolite transporter (DMT)-like permease